jgi:glutamyl-tRNA synthetase
MSLEELIQEFDFTHINKAPAVFDIVKLRWMNGEYLKNMEFEKFYELALPYIKEVVKKELDTRKIAALIKTRIETLVDIKGIVDFFDVLPEYDIEMYTHKKMKTDAQTSLKVLQDLLPQFEALEDYSEAEVERVIMAYIAEQGIKNGQGLWPVRTAVSGKQSTPGGAYEIMNILGKEESLFRIRKAIELLAAAV